MEPWATRDSSWPALLFRKVLSTSPPAAGNSGSRTRPRIQPVDAFCVVSRLEKGARRKGEAATTACGQTDGLCPAALSWFAQRTSKAPPPPPRRELPRVPTRHLANARPGAGDPLRSLQPPWSRPLFTAINSRLRQQPRTAPNALGKCFSTNDTSRQSRRCQEGPTRRKLFPTPRLRHHAQPAGGLHGFVKKLGYFSIRRL